PSTHGVAHRVPAEVDAACDLLAEVEAEAELPAEVVVRVDLGPPVEFRGILQLPARSQIEESVMRPLARIRRRLGVGGSGRAAHDHRDGRPQSGVPHGSPPRMIRAHGNSLARTAGTYDRSG